MSDIAREFTETMLSYAEQDPSGEGIHILFQTEEPVPETKLFDLVNQELGVEILLPDSNQIVPVTGNAIGQVKNICRCDLELQLLLKTYMQAHVEPQGQLSGLPEDQRLLDRIRQSKGGEKFFHLFYGSIPNGLTRREAEQSLCSMLAMWTGKDPIPMDRLFRASKLFREKWDAKRGSSTYGKLMIHRAMDRCTEAFAARNDFQPLGREDIPAYQPGDKLSVKIMELVLDELGISIRYNTLSHTADIYGIPESYSRENAVNTIPVFLKDELNARQIKGVNKGAIDDALNNIADIYRFNPVEEYLEDVEWDGRDRLSELFEIVNVHEKKYLIYFTKWLIQTVALGLNQLEYSIGAEGVLVLQGDQGIAKTLVFRILTPRGWFVEGASLDMRVKDTLINALSGWITELGELDSTLNREQSALKAFVTMTYDRIRLPYARSAVLNPRRTSFCGTVNPEKFLRDETGSRRFWTVPIDKIDKQRLISLTDEWVHQLWA